MTFSQENQKDNVSLAFREMMAELGDGSVALILFDPNREPFRVIYQTTWKELIDQGWLEEHEVELQTRYRLKGAGWIEGLWRVGAYKDQTLEQKMSGLAATLKEYVKGRERDVVVLFHKLVERTGLPEGWVFNAIESSLLSKLWNMRDASWEERGTLVRIPLNFGMKLLDHTADIRADLEMMRKELETAKEELREVTCSFCGAPIIGQGSVPVSEHDEGYYVAYACGRYDTDAYGEQACPSDPKFPKLEEYELVLRQNPKDPVFKWTCFPQPKTRNAGLLHLSSGYGRTEEEANQKVVETYHQAAKPWKR
jgi:hypothetical protein